MSASYPHWALLDWAKRADAEIAELRARVDVLTAALEFYADPETYLAVTFWFDPPCGEFMDDFDDETNHPDGNHWHKPGKRARAALAPPREEQR